MQSYSIQKVLITKANLALEKAMEISQGIQATAEQAKELKGSQRSPAVLSLDAQGEPADAVDAQITIEFV